MRLPPEHPEALLAQWLVLSGVVSASQMEEAEDHMLRSGQSLAKALSTLGHSDPETLEISVGQALGLGRSQPRLGEVLLKRGQLSPEGLQQALLTQARTGRRLGEVLVELGLCSWAQVYGALESQTDPARQTPIRTPAVAKPAKATRPRVVIIDDSPIALAMLEHGLVQNGYEVLPFGEPHQALLFLRDAPVDVVLTDMEMPGMSGLELCRRLKEPPYPALPVIILTANEEDALRVDGLRAGAEDYVSKTSSMDELLARIDSVLRRVGEARRVRSIFARYTSEAVVEEVLSKPEGVFLDGERRETTILFADLRRFTPLAESLAPEQTVRVLNEVLGRLADAVLTFGGTLDKFLGDGLMAVWGAPVQRSDDPLRALQAARRMIRSVEELRSGAQAQAEPELFSSLQIGVGLNTGWVVAGNVGSAVRTEYTCIGDAVNVASRLCGHAEPGDILLGERTHALVREHGHFEQLPPVQLKGKSQPVPVWRVGRERD
ncbi:MAG TPA: adenylate/guanylate cyclase domain-containing protein [Myxococcaceae bacterium]|nr:adenylate/guanylate cyclase domain-containing protein [Myxococcaceae bacterium]